MASALDFTVTAADGGQVPLSGYSGQVLSW